MLLYIYFFRLNTTNCNSRSFIHWWPPITSTTIQIQHMHLVIRTPNTSNKKRPTPKIKSQR